MVETLKEFTALSRPRLLLRAARLGLRDYHRATHLPRLLGLSVTSGDPISLDELLGTPTDTEEGPRRLPVPVVPEEC